MSALREPLLEALAHPSPQGTVCGLCGNFDARSNNDFTTRDNMVVESELDFGNSWKEAPTCPDVTTTPDPCIKNPHRQAWAEKQCSIIKGPVFGVCHSKVGRVWAWPTRGGRGCGRGWAATLQALCAHWAVILLYHHEAPVLQLQLHPLCPLDMLPDV